MAISTIGIFLAYGATEEYGKEVDIKDVPSLLAAKSSIETTTLRNEGRTYIDGIRETPESFDFNANYDKEIFDEINSLTAEQFCKITFPDGSAYKWKGKMSVSNAEAGINAVLGMVISVKPTTDIEWAKA